MISRSRRTLLQALAVSALLHVVALSGAPRWSPPLPAEAAALNAVLRAPAQGAAPAHAVAQPAPAASAPRPPVVAAPPLAAASPPSVVANADSPPLPSAAGGQATTPAVSGGASPPGSASATAAGASQAAPGASGRQALSGDDLRQYRLSLASAARRFKRYPALASQRGWEGTAEVALDVSASSPLPEVVLLRSSGRAVLDEQALAMLSQAARVTALPEGLKARDFRIVLPVQFSLDSDQ